MRYFNAVQAARELDVSDKTIRRYLQKGKIVATRKESGELAISEEEVDKLRQELDLERSYQKYRQGLDSQPRQDIESRLADLEQRVTSLENESRPPADMSRQSLPASAIPPKSKPTRQPSARKNALPDDCIFVRDFARQHGIAESTFRDMIVIGRGAGTTNEKQHIEETTRQHPTRKELQHFLTPEQQRAAIVFWRKWKVTFQQCNNVACACRSTIDIN